MKMPFGKFKGITVGAVPTSYLKWMIENISIREPLKSVVYNEFKKRGTGESYYPSEAYIDELREAGYEDDDNIPF